jgi:hypothetical protein
MYPIRASRPVWSKNFSRPHVCGDLCRSHVVINDNLIRMTYQTGCLYPEKIEPAYIHLSEVNTTEQIRYMDEPLPLPRRIQLVIDHPLHVPQCYTHEFAENEPILLSSLVRLFEKYYRQIYAEEELQATPREYWLSATCPDCTDDTYAESNIEAYMEPCEAAHDCFCFVEEDDEKQADCVRLTHCRHQFHRACILRWFNTPRADDDDGSTERKSNSCPNCRQPMIYCGTCQATRAVKKRFFGSVPPYDEHNEEQEDRPETDGPYRIHTIYYEELFFKGIMYDAARQCVRLLPLERVE